MKPIYCECGRVVENKDTGLCSSCGFAQRKKQRDASAPVKQVKQLKRTKPKRVSDKRKDQNKVYGGMRLEFLILNPLCVCCGNLATEIHHAAGRSNDLLLEKKYWKPICSGCHRLVTEDSAWAIREGYSISRTKIQQP